MNDQTNDVPASALSAVPVPVPAPAPVPTVPAEPKKISQIDLFKELAGYDDTTCTSRIVCVDEFVGKYEKLVCGNGGGWCRFDGPFGKKYNVVKAKLNGVCKFSWTESEEERIAFERELKEVADAKGGYKRGISIYLLKICGVQDLSSARPIRQDIRDALKTLPCVACGTTSQIEIDHKNGLYNDPRVLSASTQTIDDFQPLCKHCNDQRQTYVYSNKTGKRYGFTSIPQFKAYGIDFIEGDETFDPENPNAMVGTYWFDPVCFHSALLVKLLNLYKK